jgi:hypothetical protein
MSESVAWSIMTRVMLPPLMFLTTKEPVTVEPPGSVAADSYTLDPDARPLGLLFAYGSDRRTGRQVGLGSGWRGDFDMSERAFLRAAEHSETVRVVVSADSRSGRRLAMRSVCIASRRGLMGASRYGRPMLADFTLTDQEGRPWRLSDHLDAAAMLVFLRGDW